MAASLDNFIARPDGGVEWLQWTEEVAAFTSRFWKTIDAVVMGRKTYEVAAQSGTPAYPGVTTYVCSRSLKKIPYPAPRRQIDLQLMDSQPLGTAAYFSVIE